MNRLFTWLRYGVNAGEPFWMSRWFVVLCTILAAVVVTLIMLVRYDYLETGFGGKTIWDWIEVVGVPVSVTLIGVLWGVAALKSSQRAEAERELARQRADEATLREYLDGMSDLILNHNLPNSSVDSPERAVARARTLDTLLSLNGPRKGILLRFLYEAKLIRKDTPVVSLALADLKSSDLSSADLKGSDLSRANLSSSDFDGANLEGSDLSHANLNYSRFYNTNLRNVNLLRSVVSDELLAQAKDLVGATMPDGSEMTEDRWKELKQSQL